MIGKIVGAVIVLIMLIFSLFFFYHNMVQESVVLQSTGLDYAPTELINYGAVPVFSENLRFNHNMISYSIDSACDGVRRKAMVEGFRLFAEEMKIITFYEVEENADIDVMCSNDYIPLGGMLFAAGEGGPSRIINTSVFKTIEKGRISLYSDPRCDYPIVEIHELGHVFGFDHSPDPNNIMYNTSNCDQRISADMVKLINDLYSIEPLPDASISDIEATKKGVYLDFNITILNEGLMGIEDVDLTIFADGESVQVMELGQIDIGYGRTMRATNVRLPSRSVKVIDFIVDEVNAVKEFREDNNNVTMTIQSQ